MVMTVVEVVTVMVAGGRVVIKALMGNEDWLTVHTMNP